MTPDPHARYHRQTLLPDIGEAGQARSQELRGPIDGHTGAREAMPPEQSEGQGHCGVEVRPRETAGEGDGDGQGGSPGRRDTPAAQAHVGQHSDGHGRGANAYEDIGADHLTGAGEC